MPDHTELTKNVEQPATNGVVEILTTVLTAMELLPKIAKVAQEIIPGAGDNLKDKFHWIQCSLKNETQFNLSVMGSHFDSGRYWKAPDGTGEFSQMVFSCCNGDGAITGATGGTAFRLWLDSKSYFDFAVGWTDPLAGSIKAGVTESSKAEEGYKSATREGGYIQSKSIFQGKDKEGKPQQFVISISASPGKDPMAFSVQQIPYRDDKPMPME